MNELGTGHAAVFECYVCVMVVNQWWYLLVLRAGRLFVSPSPVPSHNNPSCRSPFMPSPRGITFGLCLFYLSYVCSSRPFHLSPSAPGSLKLCDLSSLGCTHFERLTSLSPTQSLFVLLSIFSHSIFCTRLVYLCPLITYLVKGLMAFKAASPSYRLVLPL